jgi:hypothetical protein
MMFPRASVVKIDLENSPGFPSAGPLSILGFGILFRWRPGAIKKFKD